MANLEEQEEVDKGRGSTTEDKETKSSLKNYYGIIITPENRREYIEAYGIEAVRVAQKQYKAWLKGKLFFTYKGEQFPVMTQAYVDHMESQKEFLTQIEQIKEIQENEKQEEE